MSKKLLIVGIFVGLFLQKSANASFFSHGLQMKLNASKHQMPGKLKAASDYVDFSGEWVGSCDFDPDENSDLNIILAPDLSSIILNSEQFLIDGISTTSQKNNNSVEENNIHLHWSKDGKALLGTMLGYYKGTNLALNGLNSWTGKVNFFINNDKLNMEYNISIFQDGEFSESFQEKCIYSRK